MKDLYKHHKKFYFPWREGNRFEILIDGPNFFSHMLNAIDAARQYILLEMYLIESGTVADRFITAIQHAAERGVQVYMLLDDYGAIGLRQSERDRLTHKNIKLAYYNKLRSHSTLYNLYRIFLLHHEHSLYRNHRKLLLVDGNIAFVGGTGLTDEFDPPNHPEKRWHETMVKIQGPVIADWQQLFIESWNKSSQQDLRLPAVEPDELSAIQTVGQSGRVTVNNIQRSSEILLSLTSRIYNAHQRIWLSSAYFLPGWRIRGTLKRAAKSGIDVRLLLPGPITDHPAVRYASHRLYGRLLKSGVRIFEYQPRFLHSKCILCDDWVSIGSSNFDRWNLRWNLEANQEIKDESLANQVKKMFEHDFSNSVEYTYDEWRQRNWRLRIVQWFWKQIERFSLKIGR